MPPKLVRVGIAVVEHANRYLVGVRGPTGPLAGYDEFPGGKCIAHETAAACAVRECKEETNLSILVTQPLYHRRFEYPHATVDLSFYLSVLEFSDGDLIPTPPFRWVDLRELCGLRFPDANQEVVSLLWDRAQKRDENRAGLDRDAFLNPKCRVSPQSRRTRCIEQIAVL